ncbi:class I SAM-dependent methyltransferase [Pseudomonas quasicaspiana]|uniref:class I SAM-dependent methyltransferase n=1 Tax=Pseudomonas quasicaspiana TaxID=2829821 RepID=UPI001E31CCA3|nr:class I SAM-dependent methyltransferase [Pseudomonas quasicaspiana]MCD5971706.1 class I SAM-dependent methyltransferase [Pseudomonas quasicaspiana]
MDKLTPLIEVDCPVCSSKSSAKLFYTHDYVFGSREETFAVQRCKDCGVGYLSPRPVAAAMPKYYPEAFYWSWEGAGGKMDWSSILEKRGEQLRGKAEWLKGITPGALLDIGAQKGEFLWFMQKQGWSVEGIEMDSSVPNPGDLPIRYGDFLQMDFAEKKYDVITFWAVLEHVYEPKPFIEKAAQLLKPNGRLVVLVTNLNSIQSRFYQADDYPRHLTIFTHSSLKRLCEDHGLTLARSSTDQKIFGGSLAGGAVYIVKRLGGYRAGEALAEWKQQIDPDLFWCKWRGQNSLLMKMISRADRLITWPVEKVLDRMGYGLTLTITAHKSSDNE